MARFDDYSKNSSEEEIDEGINKADNQQQTRQEASTTVDWENRYKELEKLNSRQAQNLGEYRKLVDDYIVKENSTQTNDNSANAENNESATISHDEWFDDPNSAFNKAVESHPAIRDARKLKEDTEKKSMEEAIQNFQTRHSDYNEIGGSPEFQNWVADDSMRVDLYKRADQFDLSAADALFSLYKAEKGIRQVQDQEDLRAAELESSSAQFTQEPAKYSRTEYVNKLMRARQGDLEADDWVKRNAPAYREALVSGNVRD